MATPTDSISLSADAGAPQQADVHIVVLLSILDHHLRRSDKQATGGSAQDRIIGVLLGSYNTGIVEISNCFGIQHVLKDSKVCFFFFFSSNIFFYKYRK